MRHHAPQHFTRTHLHLGRVYKIMTNHFWKEHFTCVPSFLVWANISACVCGRRSAQPRDTFRQWTLPKVGNCNIQSGSRQKHTQIHTYKDTDNASDTLLTLLSCCCVLLWAVIYSHKQSLSLISGASILGVWGSRPRPIFWAWGCGGWQGGRRGLWTGFGKHYSVFCTESRLENVFL